MEKLKPKLLSVLKTYPASQFSKDAMAGVIVAIIALPLSIAFALGCGVSPEKGIYSAIISSIIVALLGGSRVQINGPTGAFIVITQSVIAGYGLQGLTVATMLAGVILILMGFFKIGRFIKFIPSPITIGFTGGIAITIFTLEVKDFLGITPAGAPTSFIGKWQAYIAEFPNINWQAVILGAVCIVILVIWPKINRVIPNSFVALVIGTAATYFLKLDVKLLGDIPKTLSLPELSGLGIDDIFSLMSPAFTIAILIAMQALLSAVVTDELVNSKHRPSMELIAQGIANIVLGFLGCIPATGGVARSIANAKNGGRSPIAAIFHGITLFIMLMFGMPLIKLVPLPVLAAILIVVSYNMFNIKAFLSYLKAPKSDLAVLLTSCILTFAFDLVFAIEVGMVLACALFMKRMADVTEVHSWKYISNASVGADEENDAENIYLKKVPEGVKVFEISGPMFFGATDKLVLLQQVAMEKGTKVLILRMRSVPAIDETAMNTLRNIQKKLKAEGITMIFSHALEQPRRMMEKNKFVKEVGVENFCENIDAALMRASKIIEAEQ